MSCHKTSDNKHFDCPPRMDDGRHFTDYRTNCHINNLVRSNNAISNSHQYRMFLTHNGERLMNLNRAYATQKNNCGDCDETMLPEQTSTSCDANSCNTQMRNPSGLGNGRNNGSNSDCENLSKNVRKNNLSSCCANSNDLFNYYNHADTLAQGNSGKRNTVPSGGKVMQGGDPEPFNL